MRLAWFSPLPPTKSGIAPYNWELLPALTHSHQIDVLSRASHARGRMLLQQWPPRQDEYRHEFWFNHPDANPDLAELGAVDLLGSLTYLWPMLRMSSSRAAAWSRTIIGSPNRSERHIRQRQSML